MHASGATGELMSQLDSQLCIFVYDMVVWSKKARCIICSEMTFCSSTVVMLLPSLLASPKLQI